MSELNNRLKEICLKHAMKNVNTTPISGVWPWIPKLLKFEL
jgi:hypothetical protein